MTSRKDIKDIFVVTQGLSSVIPYLEKSLPHLQFHLIPLEKAVGGKLNPLIQITEHDIEQLQDAVIIIADNWILGHLAYKLPKTQWIQGAYAGVDLPLKSITPAVIAEKGLPPFITTRFSGECYATCMFEYSLSFIVMHERKFNEYLCEKSCKDWSKLFSFAPSNFRFLNELTVSILGIGGIGVTMAKKFKEQVGCKVLGFGRKAKTFDQSILDFYACDISPVIEMSDVIISLLPATNATGGVLNDAFEVCKKKPLFISLGRGNVISSESIIRSLDKGWISQAVLDVFEQEPLPPGNPLWQHPQVIITPHVSCQTRPQDLAKVFEENYKRFVDNDEMMYQVDWRNQY